jgi:hypothetical protein
MGTLGRLTQLETSDSRHTRHFDSPFWFHSGSILCSGANAGRQEFRKTHLEDRSARLFSVHLCKIRSRLALSTGRSVVFKQLHALVLSL